MYATYIIDSASLDRFYTGITDDPDRRITEHRSGHSLWTARASDWDYVYLRLHPSRAEAMKLEKMIKRAKSRRSIQRFVDSPDNAL